MWKWGQNLSFILDNIFIITAWFYSPSLILQNTFVTIKMFLYSNVSFILNSIHFHSFLALLFLSLSKNVKDAAFLLKCRFYAAFTQTCVKAVETQVLRSFYPDLHKSCRNAGFTQLLRRSNCCVSAAFAHHDYFYEALRKSFIKAVEKLFCSFSAELRKSFVKAGFSAALRKTRLFRRCQYRQLLRSFWEAFLQLLSCAWVGGCPGWSESSQGAQSFCWFCHEAAQLNCLGNFWYLSLMS